MTCNLLFLLKCEKCCCHNIWQKTLTSYIHYIKSDKHLFICLIVCLTLTLTDKQEFTIVLISSDLH